MAHGALTALGPRGLPDTAWPPEMPERGPWGQERAERCPHEGSKQGHVTHHTTPMAMPSWLRIFGLRRHHRGRGPCAFQTWWLWAECRISHPLPKHLFHHDSQSNEVPTLTRQGLVRHAQREDKEAWPGVSPNTLWNSEERRDKVNVHQWGHSK